MPKRDNDAEEDNDDEHVIYYILISCNLMNSKSNRKHYELYYVISVMYEFMKKNTPIQAFPFRTSHGFLLGSPTHRWFWCSGTWHWTWTHSNALPVSLEVSPTLQMFAVIGDASKKAGYIWEVTYPLHLPFFWIYRSYTSLSPTSWILILNHPNSF